jgi:hypothetical protein
MSNRLVSASVWNTAKGTVNTLLTNFNNVHVASTSGSIAPPITLEPAISLIVRSVAGGAHVKDDEYSDTDGIVTKYNLLRKYESCRRIDSSAVTHNNQTISSAGVIGTRTPSFPASTPDYITPPNAGDLVKDFTLGNDILEIITAGVAIHNTTVLGVAPGAEYVVINECHSACHGACHGDCRRSKR